MQPRTSVGQRGLRAALRIGLINNMPDAALQSTEAQFFGLLKGAAGSQPITVRLSSFPELPRSAEALAQIGSYWPLEELLAEPLDAFIVTGTEPKAARLADEPYWPRFAQLLEYAESRRIASIWSCLAAHAAVESLDGIQRQRLPQKRCGVYAHSTLAGHALLAQVPTPLAMPHSRWNELSAEALRQAGYTLLSWSDTSGADAFVKERASLLLFFQGHPEYEGTTLLKEYRRDVGRYLNAPPGDLAFVTNATQLSPLTGLHSRWAQRTAGSQPPTGLGPIYELRGRSPVLTFTEVSAVRCSRQRFQGKQRRII